MEARTGTNNIMLTRNHMEIGIFCLQVEAEPPNPLYKVGCRGWTTLHPFPSRERFYQVVCPGYTLEGT